MVVKGGIIDYHENKYGTWLLFSASPTFWMLFSASRFKKLCIYPFMADKSIITASTRIIQFWVLYIW